jgi:hypothetical protein
MRISTTTLESFRLFMQPDQDWMTEADLIASIRGEFVPTPAVLLGSAFGKVLEDPRHYRVPHGYQCGGYTFADEVMAPALRLMDHDRGLFEVKAKKAYGDCEVVAVADQIVGAHLFEHKTTATFNFEKYADSCQWRFMVDIFEPLLVTYHVFEMDDHGNGVAEIKGIHTFNLFPYAGLHQDCCELLGAFCDYVRAKQLDGLLRERQREKATAA